MTRSTPWFARMAWLALAAVLLMSVAPTVSRALAAGASKAVPILMEMCTTAGLELVDVAPFIGGGEAPVPPSTAMSDACGYCVLATPLLVVLSLLCAMLLRAPPPAVVRLRRLCLPARRNLRGLGAQAPPLSS